MDNYEAHGFTVASSRNCVLIKARPATARAPTAGRGGDADRRRDHLRRQADGRWAGPGPREPTRPVYSIVTTIRPAPLPGAVRLRCDRMEAPVVGLRPAAYPNGKPFFDALSRPLNLNGDPIVDESKNAQIRQWRGARLGQRPAGDGAERPPGGASRRRPARHDHLRRELPLRLHRRETWSGSRSGRSRDGHRCPTAPTLGRCPFGGCVVEPHHHR